MPDVDYTPYSSSRFLPPSINPTSLILHLHYGRRLSPALIIESFSFTSHSLALFCFPPVFLFFLFYHTSSGFDALLSPHFHLFHIISEFSLREKHAKGQK